MKRGGAYTKAIGMLPGIRGGKSTPYWNAPKLRSTGSRQTAFGRQLKRTKIKGGYLEEDMGQWGMIEKNMISLKHNHNAVKVGVFATYSGTELVSYAAKNELGWQNIPQRSYIGKTFDTQQRSIKKRFEQNAASILSGSIGADKFLESEGILLRNQIQEFIYGFYWTKAKPNTPATVRRKGFQHPLINKGDLVNALTYELTKEIT